MIDRRALVLGVGAALVGCAGKPAPLPPTIPPRPLALRPLTSLVPAGGLSWMIDARPMEFLRDPRAAKAVLTLAPQAREDSLAQHLGLDVRSAERLVFARFGETSLVLIDLPHDQERATKKFAERLSDKASRVVDDTRISWLSGKIGPSPRAFADLQGEVAIYEAGPSLPLRAAVAFAEGKLKKAKSALTTAPLDGLVPQLATEQIALYAPRRASEGWAEGKHALFDEAHALGLGLSAAPEGARLRFVVTGDFSGHVDPAIARLRKIVDEVGASPLGHLLGLDAKLADDVATPSDKALALARTVSFERLADGLKAAVVADMPEIFGPKR